MDKVCISPPHFHWIHFASSLNLRIGLDLSGGTLKAGLGHVIYRCREGRKGSGKPGDRQLRACGLRVCWHVWRSLLRPQAIDPIRNVALAPAQTAKADLAWLWHAVELNVAINGRAASETGEVHDLLHSEQVVRLMGLHARPFCTWLGRKACLSARLDQSAYVYAELRVNVTGGGAMR
jgi:hypothetical protein